MLLPQPGWHRVAVAAILVIPLLTLILLSLPAWITWPFLSTERRMTVLWRRAWPAHLAEPPLQQGLRRREPPADTPPSQNQRFAQRRTAAERVRAAGETRPRTITFSSWQYWQSFGQEPSGINPCR